MQPLYLLVPLAPLAGSLLAGLFGKTIGRAGAHTATILSVAVAFIASCIIAQDVIVSGNTFNGALYTWATSGNLKMEVGFLIDPLTVMMMLVVTFVSLMVHVYTIGYMQDDPGYQRFFSYISLFTFSMLMLVMSNNFLQLFFGWEAVGLVSYLLIGFWYTRPTAIYANLKAFLVNRVGDFGFVLGIGFIAAYFGSLDYATVFAAAPGFVNEVVRLVPGIEGALLTVVCIGLFIGAMGKSAQFPLHVWLPDSMEGPTPISALIHAATMVTAGIFMVTRMSPLFELSETALSVVMVIGAITALFMGFLGVVQNDIKRVVAYSTLSQLGYMTVALGASAYPVAIFHLMTHAFFKALLFLAAGSVIMGMHHNQDVRSMGALRKYMPITWITSLLGSLALIGTPFFSGFYSKDSIIEAVAESHITGAGFAYFAVVAGVFVTAFYSFRMYFLVFHGTERWRAGRHHTDRGHAAAADAGHGDRDAQQGSHGRDSAHGAKHDDHGHHHGSGPHDDPRESPWVVTLPLVLLAIPSVVVGFLTIAPMLYGDYFGDAILIAANHHGMHEMAEEFHGPVAMALHGLTSLPFWLALSGVVVAAVCYLKRPDIPAAFKARFSRVHRILENKYGFDDFNQWFFANGAQMLGGQLWQRGDRAVIDGIIVNGSAGLVGRISSWARHGQTGFVYTYAFTMIIGVVALLGLWLSV